MKKPNLSLYRIFRKMGVPREQVALKTNLYKDLGFDASDINILLFFIESRFNININEKEIGRLVTIGHTINFVEEKIDEYGNY